MTLNASNLVAWHGRNTGDHIALRDKYEADGFRPLSLSVYGSHHDPLYAAVMVKRPIVLVAKSFVNLDQAGYQAKFDDMASQGFGPFIITATGPSGSAVFAGSFRKMSHIPLTRSNLSKAEFIELNRKEHDAGGLLSWADVFGTEDDPRYCAIYGLNPDRIAWNIDAVDEEGDTLRQRVDAMVSVGARPALTAVTPAGRIMMAFFDSQIGKCASRRNMTPAEYQTEVDAQAQNDLWPVCVSASGTGDSARFAAIFATQEEHRPRVFRATGTPKVAAIDSALENYVKDLNLRGVALAIVQDTRLVYARGYTFAEADPHYADVQPTTPFRQASCSKTFCAVAVWTLIEQGKLSLDTTLQSVLNLKQPDGSAPQDSRFKDITIRHMLESRTGIDQDLVWAGVDASAAAGGTLPANGMEVARWVATKPLTGKPGDKTNTSYGSTDYLLLSLIVAEKTNAASFEAALKDLVLDPLHMKHTRSSRSLAGAQHDDEARHHMTVHDPDSGWPLVQLETLSSVKTPDRPLVPTHYGSYDYELFDGPAGVSASVVDVARLLAMFACRNGNPLLKKGTIDTMLAAAVAATGSQTGPAAHGYHGFDWASNIDPANHQVRIGKGGWLPGQGTSFSGVTGDLFYVIAQNGNRPHDVTTDWLDPITPIAEAHDWGTVDHFPSFGLPKLAANEAGEVGPRPAPVGVLLAKTMKQVESSMARRRRA